MNKSPILFAFLLMTASGCLFAQQPVHVVGNNSSQTRFAIAKISKSLIQKGFTVTVNYNETIDKKAGAINIILATEDEKKWKNLVFSSLTPSSEVLKPEGFRIQCVKNKNSQTFLVIGKDPAGLMYGGLELAELIKTSDLTSLTDVIRNPYMNKRGIKMNIPLDARTPSYTDASDAAQQNIAEMWNLDFWKEHIDSLASYRYNLISLWNLHPFPSMVKVPEYPEVALNDVHRSTIKWEEYYSSRGTGIDVPAVVDHFEVVKKISIEDKIKFWQEVMQYGKERNIDFYIVTWNIFTNSTKGKYGITDDYTNPVTKDYFRKSIKQLFLTYPDLAGIGLTTGENMPGADFEAKENWSFETYGQGVLDVAKDQPNRKITFIHRQHEAGALEIVEKFKPLVENKSINFIFSFKYAQAHVFSSTTQTYHPEFVKEIKSRNLKTLWTLRNDDAYYFRWGSAAFVREFIQNIPLDVSEGFYYGSDQYIWGREFLDNHPGDNRPIELAKHWYHWMLWGRLGYDPAIKDEQFIRILQNHFPGINAKILFDAWHSASMIYPLTTGFHWGALDFQWYIEACKSRPEPAQTLSGYHDMNRFITLPPHKGTDYISIPDFIKTKDVKPKSGTTPQEVAQKINHFADHALEIINAIPSTHDRELHKTIQDIKAISYLGKYYAHKINAATNLALFRSDSNKIWHESMIKELNISALYWRYYASTGLGQYKNPLWTNRVGHVDWRDIYKYVLKEITDNQGEINIANMETTAGGAILEAERATLTNAQLASGKSGFTSIGYIKATSANNKIEWTVEATEPGDYVLEFRYLTTTEASPDGQEAQITINNKPSGKIIFWQIGTDKNWVWDKVPAKLEKGSHTLSINLPVNVLLDHLNIQMAWVTR